MFCRCVVVVAVKILNQCSIFVCSCYYSQSMCIVCVSFPPIRWMSECCYRSISIRQTSVNWIGIKHVLSLARSNWICILHSNKMCCFGIICVRVVEWMWVCVCVLIQLPIWMYDNQCLNGLNVWIVPGYCGNLTEHIMCVCMKHTIIFDHRFMCARFEYCIKLFSSIDWSLRHNHEYHHLLLYCIR